MIAKDSSGALVPDVHLTLINAALKAEFKTISDAGVGLYYFLRGLPGRYDLRNRIAGIQDAGKEESHISPIPTPRYALMPFSKLAKGRTP